VPGPASYNIVEAFDHSSANGGTGLHTGYAVSFTKGERDINKSVELKSYIPGPGTYYSANLGLKSKTS